MKEKYKYHTKYNNQYKIMQIQQNYTKLLSIMNKMILILQWNYVIKIIYQNQNQNLVGFNGKLLFSIFYKQPMVFKLYMILILHTEILNWKIFSLNMTINQINILLNQVIMDQ
ncbi:hypothetical protein IMG5_013700 [Ichthyophthirius multifiliis]|uniref:Uncharacterized protein n=1 Tax=Ichthyophthirius multifiliis TaxID=5932 RepID=G0QK70_ICHMU|nr:hypothetical protein IMG5_013700 [Ichthyophthirius multifiliis]EGR34386.1 hypothetical protein IMG5_013700 [Ichthyophthirius multifiliis]|eukprot:XP_004039690.1 hypothetical protein IMG5_013700 [Ichthyophthirius multifiliis]